MKQDQLLATLPLLDDLLRESHRRSFYRFFVDMWPEFEPAAPYIDAPHIKALCDHLQALYEGTFSNLSIEIGPGYGKSLVCNVAFPAWIWGARKNPQYRMGFSTYADDLTTRDAGKFRTLIQSETYQRLYGHIFKTTKLTDGLIRNDKSGYRAAFSVKGQVTGHRVNLWICDDLLNMREAYLESSRKEVKTHLKAISSRGQIGKPYKRVVIGQRLHMDDAGGWARDRGGFVVLCLPTEYDPSRHCTTPIFTDWRKQPGELLFPEGFGSDKVAEAKIDLGPYDYSAQHQQLPVPVDGGVLKRSWWAELNPFPNTGQKYVEKFLSLDSAFTENEKNDTSAIVILGITDWCIDVLDCWAGRLEMPQLLGQIKAMAAQHKPTRVIVEAKANGLSIIQTLRQDSTFPYFVQGYNPGKLSKDARAHAAAPYVARKLVRVPTSAPWSANYFSQMDIFPAGKVRDLADAAIQGILVACSLYTFDDSPVIPEPPKPAAAPVHKDDVSATYERDFWQGNNQTW